MHTGSLTINWTNMSSATATPTTVLHTNTYCVEVSAVFCLDDNICTREVPTNMYALYALYWY